MFKKILLPILALILAAAILLVLFNALGGLRNANREEELQKKMETILPGSTTFTPEAYDGEDANIEFIYKGETGFVVGTRTAGYAGDIKMLIGVSNEGSVTGLQVRSMKETPGLGTEALTNWEFLSQFLRTEGDAEVGTNVDAITGATVTSRAVARSINSAVAVVTGADAASSATTWGG